MLLHYNDQLTYTVQQLVEYTAIDQNYMMSLLESMIKMKLLKQSDQSKQPLCEASIIEINTAYNEYVFTFHRKKLVKKLFIENNSFRILL